MKKIFLIITLVILTLSSCTKKQTDVYPENAVKPDFIKEDLDEKFGTDKVYIVKTYIESPSSEMQNYLNDGKIFTMVKHYQLSDGTWKTDEHTYKYKLIIKGRMHNAAKDSTYEILSNRDDITFDMAWKAAGYSSNKDDYFMPEDAIIVGIS